MQSRSLIALSWMLLFCATPVVAQQTSEKQKDSAAVYKKIESYSKKRKWTSTLHGLIFEPMTPKKIKARKKRQYLRYQDFHGKIVRKIDIVTLDPFGYSELDSTVQPKRRIARIGNRIHLKTKRLTILNLILIKRNQPLDSLLVKESERLIRAQRYTRRVLITPRPTPYKDSVDIEIRELDSWSLIPDFSASSSRMEHELTERNFLGFGHQVSQRYEKNFATGDDGYRAKYTIPNIMNTYVRSALTYQIDMRSNYLKSVDIQRPFFSPFARWAGGVYFDQKFRTDTLPDANNDFSWQNFKTNATDVWAGLAVPFLNGSGEQDRTTRLVFSGRYYKLNFVESPEVAYDTVDFYATERNYLIGVGVNSRQFVPDHYLFNYGIIEDVPVGTAIGLTAGVQRKHDRLRSYVGARLAVGDYYRLGYFSTNLEYGTYFNHGDLEQQAFSYQINYFTDLYESGRWKFRQFVKGRVVVGNDREPSWGDMLTLKGTDGIQGLDSRTLFGTKKWLVSAQTQSYSPWKWLGFSLNPYFAYSVGMLGDGPHGFSKSKTYSQIGLGVLISNDFLVFSSFQLSFSYYPTMPEDGGGVFKTNAFNTEDFGFMEFELSKPTTAYYQ